LRGLGLGIHYEGLSSTILSEFVLPALGEAVEYDRLTSFFSVSSLLAISEGIDELWRRDGHMRLVIGIHDVPQELVTAASGEAWVDRLVAIVRERLLQDVARLPDEFARNRIGTLAWMMRDGLLSIRVAAPVGPQAISTVQSIFHSKRLIFRDPSGDVVTAVGSPNETVAGLAGNFEELTVHMSWNDSLGYVRTHQESFERIWTGTRPELAVRALDESFGRDLARAADRAWTPPSSPIAGSAYGELLAACRHFPSLANVNLGYAALFPHQESALMDALDRWPVRVLLADEVGLGKTLEAGAVLAFLLRHRAIKRIAILAPKNVVRQWRDEMATHFGLDFWVYVSAGRYFESSNQIVRKLPPGSSPVGSAAPDLLVMSAQLARGSGPNGDLFETANLLPDLLVVDEAHAARVRRDVDGSRRPTRLWRMLDRLADRIPHLVFLTATPLQLDWGEYYSLLELLGLPEEWGPREYERSLSILASPGRPSLNDANAAARLLEASRAAFGLEPEEPLPEAPYESAVERAIAVSAHWNQFYASFVRGHPASILTVRNSRQALEKLGYRFPGRIFDAPALEIPGGVADFYESVRIYLRDAYGTTEVAIAGRRRVNLGFAKSTYYQRLASTLEAARQTLERRRDRLSGMLDGNASGYLDDDEGLDDEEANADEASDEEQPDEAAIQRIERAVAIERLFVEDLLTQLSRVAAEGHEDPKLATLIPLLRDVIEQDKALVFSRYTDSVDACVAAFQEATRSARVGHGVYTGRGAWIDIGSGPTPVSKDGVRQALEEGLIRAVFCSDAASEGLNLQAARVVINVDVPWNPARLEQRIGRVARLGQTADTVRIVNLWYPDSVEAQMYGRLLERRDLYQLAVGSVPQLFGDVIRAEVASRLGEAEPARDVIEELQQLREDLQVQAISRVWDRGVAATPQSQSLREKLAGLVGTAMAATSASDPSSRLARPEVAGRLEFTVEPGRRDSLTLLHPVLDDLPLRSGAGTNNHPLFIVETEDGSPIAACIGMGESFSLIVPEDVPDLLAACIGLAPFAPSQPFEWCDSDSVMDSASRAASESKPSMPGSGKTSMPRPRNTSPWPRPALPRATRLRAIGFVWIAVSVVPLTAAV
jgi:superfamily II DNA or RNA helicase